MATAGFDLKRTLKVSAIPAGSGQAAIERRAAHCGPIGTEANSVLDPLAGGGPACASLAGSRRSAYKQNIVEADVQPALPIDPPASTSGRLVERERRLRPQKMIGSAFSRLEPMRQLVAARVVRWPQDVQPVI